MLLAGVDVTILGGTVSIDVNDGLGHTLVLEDDAQAGYSHVVVDGSSTVPFANPTNLLRVNGLAGDDTIVLNELDAAFDAAVELNGGGDKDQITVNAVTGSGKVTVTGGGGEDLISLLASGVEVNAGAGDDMITAGAAGLSATVKGSGGVDTLQGPDSTTDWTIIGDDRGHLGGPAGVLFSNVESLRGGSGDDWFFFQDAHVVTGTVDGGTGTSDQIVIEPAVFDSVAYTATGANSGVVAFDAGASSISYTGVELILDSSDATTREFSNDTGSGQTLRLTDDGIAANNISAIEPGPGSAFTRVVFANPQTSLTIRAGDQGDTIDVTTGLDSDFLVDLIVTGGAGNDVLKLAPAGTTAPLLVTFSDASTVDEDVFDIDGGGGLLEFLADDHLTIDGPGGFLDVTFDAATTEHVVITKVQISADHKAAIRSVLDDLARAAEKAEDDGDLGAELPLTDTTLGELSDAGFVLRRLYDDVDAALDDPASPIETSEQLAEMLRNWPSDPIFSPDGDPITVTVELAQESIHIQPPIGFSKDLTVDFKFGATRTIELSLAAPLVNEDENGNGVLDAGEDQDGDGLLDVDPSDAEELTEMAVVVKKQAVGAENDKWRLTSRLTADLHFGSEYGVADSGFVMADAPILSVRAEDVAPANDDERINTGVLIGFLGADFELGEIDYDASADVLFEDANADGRLSQAELAGLASDAVFFAPSVAVSVPASTISIPGHTFTTGQALIYQNNGGDDIGGLTNGAIYYVIEDTPATIKLAATRDDALDHTPASPKNIVLTSQGGGTDGQGQPFQHCLTPLVSTADGVGLLDVDLPVIVRDKSLFDGARIPSDGTITIIERRDDGQPGDPAGERGDFFESGIIIHVPSELKDFLSLDAPGVLAMMGQIGNWLTEFSQSQFFDTEIPFVKDTTLGEVINFGTAFRQTVTDQLQQEAPTSTAQDEGRAIAPTFESAQELAQQLATHLGLAVKAAYDRPEPSEPGELSYVVSISREFDELLLELVAPFDVPNEQFVLTRDAQFTVEIIGEDGSSLTSTPVIVTVHAGATDGSDGANPNASIVDLVTDVHNALVDQGLALPPDVEPTEQDPDRRLLVADHEGNRLILRAADNRVKQLRVTAGDGAYQLGFGDEVLCFGFVPTDDIIGSDNSIRLASDGLVTGQAVIYRKWKDAAVGGLTDGGVYYAIVVQDTPDTIIKLAATRADALAHTESDPKNITFAVIPVSGAVHTLIRTSDFLPTTDIASDTISLPSHGLSTGQAVIYDSGGDVDVGGLASNRTFYVIEAGADAVRLALSRADAREGTAVALSTAGVTPGAVHTLTETHTTTSKEVRVAFDVDTGPFADLATYSTLDVTASGSMDFTFGFDLAANFRPVLGLGLYEEGQDKPSDDDFSQFVDAAPANGILTGDATFRLILDGEPVDVKVLSASTNGDDGQTPNNLVLGSDPVRIESEEFPEVVFNNGQLASDATFTLDLDGTRYEVTVRADATDGTDDGTTPNEDLTDFIDDLNAAIALVPGLVFSSGPLAGQQKVVAEVAGENDDQIALVAATQDVATEIMLNAVQLGPIQTGGTVGALAMEVDADGAPTGEAHFKVVVNGVETSIDVSDPSINTLAAMWTEINAQTPAGVTAEIAKISDGQIVLDDTATAQTGGFLVLAGEPDFTIRTVWRELLADEQIVRIPAGEPGSDLALEVDATGAPVGEAHFKVVVDGVKTSVDVSNPSITTLAAMRAEINAQAPVGVTAEIAREENGQIVLDPAATAQTGGFLVLQGTVDFAIRFVERLEFPAINPTFVEMGFSQGQSGSIYRNPIDELVADIQAALDDALIAAGRNAGDVEAIARAGDQVMLDRVALAAGADSGIVTMKIVIPDPSGNTAVTELGYEDGEFVIGATNRLFLEGVILDAQVEFSTANSIDLTGGRYGFLGITSEDGSGLVTGQVTFAVNERLNLSNPDGLVTAGAVDLLTEEFLLGIELTDIIHVDSSGQATGFVNPDGSDLDLDALDPDRLILADAPLALPSPGELVVEGAGGGLYITKEGLDAILAAAGQTRGDFRGSLGLATPAAFPFSTANVTTVTDTITLVGNSFVQGQAVLYDNGGGTSIGGLSHGETYFVIKGAGDDIQLAATRADSAAGTAIDLEPGGQGAVHRLLDDSELDALDLAQLMNQMHSFVPDANGAPVFTQTGITLSDLLNSSDLTMGGFLTALGLNAADYLANMNIGEVVLAGQDMKLTPVEDLTGLLEALGLTQEQFLDIADLEALPSKADGAAVVGLSEFLEAKGLDSISVSDVDFGGIIEVLDNVDSPIGGAFYEDLTARLTDDPADPPETTEVEVTLASTARVELSNFGVANFPNAEDNISLPGSENGELEIVLGFDGWIVSPNSGSGPDTVSIAPAENATQETLDFLDQFQTIDFATVVDGLVRVADYLDELSDKPNLGKELPLLGLSVNDLLDFASVFRTDVAALAQQTSTTFQTLEATIKAAFGYPLDSDNVIVEKTGDDLRIDLSYLAGFLEAIPLTLDMEALLDDAIDDGTNKDNLAEVVSLRATDSSGAMDVQAGSLLELALGFDLTGSSDVPFLFGGTRFVAGVKGQADKMDFTLRTGPLGLIVVRGEATLDYDGDPDTEDAILYEYRLPGNGTRPFGADDVAAAAEATVLTAEPVGRAVATLPLYFPSDQNPVDGFLDNDGNVVPPGVNILGIQVNKLFDRSVGDVVITSPDVATLLQSADLRQFLTDPDGLIDGLYELLDIMQAAVNDELYATLLPVVGDNLGSIFESQFLANLRSPLLSEIFGQIAGAKPSEAVDRVEDALFAVFGLDKMGTHPGDPDELGLALLADDNDTREEIQAVELVEDGILKNIEFSLHLYDRMEDLLLVDGFDTALPALGLTLDSDLLVDLEWELYLTFGVNLFHGFYFKVTDASMDDSVVQPANTFGTQNPSRPAEMHEGELVIWVDAELNSASAQQSKGKLNYLKVTAVDGWLADADPATAGPVKATANKGKYNDPTPDRTAVDLSPTGLKNTIFTVNFFDPVAESGDADLGLLTFDKFTSPAVRPQDILEANVAGHADINLFTHVSFGDNANFPSLFTDFNLDWTFDNDVNVPAVKFGGGSDLKVGYLNAKLALGEFLSKFAKPILETVRDIFKPMDWMIDPDDGWLFQKDPIMSFFQGRRVILLDSLKIYDPNGNFKKMAPFLKAISYVYGVAKQIGSFADASEGVFIRIGGVWMPDVRGMKTLPLVIGRPSEEAPLPETGQVNLPKLTVGVPGFEASIGGGTIDNPEFQFTAGTVITTSDVPGQIEDAFKEKERQDAIRKERQPGFVGPQRKDPRGLQSPKASAGASVGDDFLLDFPLLFDPKQALMLFTGEHPTLFILDLPTFHFEVNVSLEMVFWVPPKVAAGLYGQLSADLKLGFGYDTLGLEKYADSGDESDVWDGFFINDIDTKAPPGTPNDRPELTLKGSLKVEANVDAGVVKVGGGGGIFGTVYFNLNDPNRDGKVRINEIEANWAEGGFTGVFDISGHIDWGLYFYVELLGIRVATFDVISGTIYSFRVPCSRKPILATHMGGGVYRLNMGPAAVERIHGITDDIDETFVVYGTPGLGGTQNIAVSFAGATVVYPGATQIVADGGQGNDTIDLRNVAIPLDVTGGPGDDVIWGGTADDELFGDVGEDQIHGGGGNDDIDGGIGDDVLWGDAGKDVLFGGIGSDLLYGGVGDDRLQGSFGDDVLIGQDDNDTYVFASRFGNDFVVEDEPVGVAIDDVPDAITKITSDTEGLVTFDGSNAAVVNVDDDTIEIAGHDFQPGHEFIYGNGGNSNVGGLFHGTPYYVTNPDDTSIQLAASREDAIAGITIDLTGLSDGGGHTLKSSFIQVRFPGHGLTVGAVVRAMVANVDGDVEARKANGIFEMTVIDADTVQLPGDVVFDPTNHLQGTGVLYGPDQINSSQDEWDFSAVRSGLVFLLEPATAKVKFDGAASVDVDNDTITVGPHDLVTGQGVLYRTGGGDAVEGLQDAATYFVITTADPTQVRLARTEEQAHAGVFIDLLDVGSGESHTLRFQVGANQAAFDGTSAHVTTSVTFNGDLSFADELLDTITVGGHDFVYGQEVLYSSGGGTAIGGLTNGATYFVLVNPLLGPGKLQLALTAGGAPIDLTAGFGDSHSLTVTNVPNANQIDVSNHGFVTGQEVVYRVGVGGTAISGLMDGRSYFVISVGPDALKLAATENDAVAGIAVPLTKVGTGVGHTLTSGDFTTVAQDRLNENSVRLVGLGVERFFGGTRRDLFFIKASSKPNLTSFDGQRGSDDITLYIGPDIGFVKVEDTGDIWNRDRLFVFGTPENDTVGLLKSDVDPITGEDLPTDQFDTRPFVLFNGEHPMIVDVDADEIRITGHGLSEGLGVKYSAGRGGPIEGLIEDGIYHVIVVDEDTIQLSDSPGGTPIDLMGVGEGRRHALRYDWPDPADPAVVAYGNVIYAMRFGPGNGELVYGMGGPGNGIESSMIQLRGGDDTGNVQSTPPNMAVGLFGQNDDDTISVGVAVDRYGEMLRQDTLNDILGEPAKGPLVTNGGQGYDVLNVFDTADEANNDTTIDPVFGAEGQGTAGQMLAERRTELLTGLGMSVGLRYVTFERVNVQLGRADDDLEIISTLSTAVTVVHAGTGQDEITASLRDDPEADGPLVLYGEAGNDVIDGRAASLGSRPGIDGFASRKFLYIDGDEGADVLRGGLGDDVIVGGSGDDTLDGRAGDDRIWGDSDLVVTIVRNDEAQVIFSNDIHVEIAKLALEVGQTYDDHIAGNLGEDKVFGEQGGDEIDGNEGRDILFGDFGSLDGNLANTRIWPEFVDGVRYQHKVTTVRTEDEVEGGSDTISGGADVDIVLGGYEGDWLYGDASVIPVVAENVTSGPETRTAAVDDRFDVLIGDNGSIGIEGGTAVAELGFAERQVGSADRLLVAVDAPAGDVPVDVNVPTGPLFQFRFKDDMTFTVRLALRDGTELLAPVKLLADTTRTNKTINHLVRDLNDALFDAGLDEFLTAASNGPNGKDGTNLTLSATDPIVGQFEVVSGAEKLGFADGQTSDFGQPLALVAANEMADVAGVLGRTAIFEFHIARTDGSTDVRPVLVFVDESNASNADFAEDLSDALSAAGLGGLLTVSEDGNRLIITQADPSVAAIELLALNQLMTVVETGVLTPANDPIFGGADEIHGSGGADIIIGGVAGDNLMGDADRDVILGDNARVEFDNGTATAIRTTDTLDTTAGVDTIHGNDERDLIFGGLLGDTIFGDGSGDVILGDNGLASVTDIDGNPLSLDLRFELVTSVDPLLGGADTVEGGGGNDVIAGGTDGDMLYGDSRDGDVGENDLIFGDHARFDRVAGYTMDLTTLPAPVFEFTAIFTGADQGAGDDIVHGDGGQDIILGQQGVDRLFGDAGDDDIAGGHNVAGGFDTTDFIDGGKDHDVIAGDNAVIHRNVDRVPVEAREWHTEWLYRRLIGAVIYDGEGVPQITGDPQPAPNGTARRYVTLLDHSDDPDANTFGADYIAGGPHDDVILGQLGDDIIQGDAAVTDEDTTESVTVWVDKTDGTIHPSAEADTDGDDHIEGNGGDDVIFGNLGRDDILGGSSNLFGLDAPAKRPDGADLVYGGAGTRLARNDTGRTTPDGHARDADFVLGDNGNIYRLVGSDGAFLTFNYDGYSPEVRLIPRAVELLDYTPSGLDTDAVVNLGTGDLLYGESGDDALHGMTGDDVLFGDGQDDDLFGEAGDDWISGGTGVDGVLGDDGLIFTSRNDEMPEPLYGIAGLTDVNVVITTPGDRQREVIQVNDPDDPADGLKKSVDLIAYPYGGDDIIFGGFGNDFLHGGQGDDAVSGAEALPYYYSGQGNQFLLDLRQQRHEERLAMGFDEELPSFESPFWFAFAPINPGNVLHFGHFDPNEFALYDEDFPRRKIMFAQEGDLIRVLEAFEEGAINFLLNFDPTEGVADLRFDEAEYPDGVISDGDDALFGDIGNDWLVGGTGRDHIYGGRGNDLINMDDNHESTNVPGLSPAKKKDPAVDPLDNNIPDALQSYADIAYGGGGRDVLILNTGADRAIDWVGEFNSYIVPFSPFGAFHNSRTLQPHLTEFLYVLSADDGADQTAPDILRNLDDQAVDPRIVDADPDRNFEPYGELGLILQQDLHWQEQTGGPDDPQAGNTQGKREIQRRELVDDVPGTKGAPKEVLVVPGDANADGLVNGGDYTVWADHYLVDGVLAFSQGGGAFGNFNEDNAVNGGDYNIWADAYISGGAGAWLAGAAEADVLLPAAGTLDVLFASGADGPLAATPAEASGSAGSDSQEAFLLMPTGEDAVSAGASDTPTDASGQDASSEGVTPATAAEEQAAADESIDLLDQIDLLVLAKPGSSKQTK